MKRNKYLSGKIIIDGIITLRSPMLIGCGEDANTDIDVIRDKTGAPFIPATSFVGVLKQRCSEVYGIGHRSSRQVLSKKEFAYIFGDHDDSDIIPSLLSCSDLCLLTGGNVVEARDGVKIDCKTGIAEDKGKYDYEVVAAGSKFKLKIEIDLFSDLENDISAEKIKGVGGTILKILKKGIRIGVKTNSGFGRTALEAGRIFLLDFNRKEDVTAWLTGDGFKERKDESALIGGHNIDVNENCFVIDISLDIKNSFIIRSYSNEPDDPDATHLKSGGRYVISGTSIKGALMARAERIARTIADNNKISCEKINAYINVLFGNSFESSRETGGKKVKIDIPSRVIVEEVVINDVCSEIQSRIKIDRFTGGVINTALFDSMPVFPLGNDSSIKNFTITVKNATDMDKGLMLLLLKDLWAGNLAIGGEKNVGRGVFAGKGATIKNLFQKENSDDGRGREIKFFNISEISEDDKKQMQGFVKKLNELPEDELKKCEDTINKYKNNN